MRCISLCKPIQCINWYTSLTILHWLGRTLCHTYKEIDRHVYFSFSISPLCVIVVVVIVIVPIEILRIQLIVPCIYHTHIVCCVPLKKYVIEWLSQLRWFVTNWVWNRVYLRYYYRINECLLTCSCRCSRHFYHNYVNKHKRTLQFFYVKDRKCIVLLFITPITL